MNNQYIAYLYESGICITLLYTFYWILLKRDTFYNLNRSYLLISILFSFVLPFLNFNLLLPKSDVFDALTRLSSPGNSLASPENSEIGNYSTGIFQSTQWLFYLYLAGVLYFTIRLVVGILKIFKLAKTGERSKHNGVSLIFTREDFAPFSFLNMIFINKVLIKGDQLDEILDHEYIHSKQYHSIDLLIMELMLIIQWFNPIVWLVKKSLKETHEYLVDNNIVKKGYDKGEYQRILLCYIKGVKMVGVSNNFNRLLLKKRIQMMLQPESSKLSKFKILLSIPLILLILLVFACSGIRNDSTQTAIISVPDPEQIVPDPNDTTDYSKMIYFTVDEMPTFQGGNINRFRKYVMVETKIPNGITVDSDTIRIFVQFIVTPEGKVDKVQVITPVHPDIDKEVLKVVESSPLWKPGKQKGQLTNVAYTTRFDISIK